MADKSKIEWTDATWNPITGCTLVDEGCRHCYAAHLITSWPAIGNHPSRKGLARKNAAGESKFTGEVRLNEQWLDQPLKWRKPRKIFVCAHGDLFHPNVPDEWIDRVFAVMAFTPQHTFQVLTKRPERAREYLSQTLDRVEAIEEQADVYFGSNDMPFTPHWPLPNVWLGTSISDQASADLRIPDLLACPAAVRFISAEPMLGPIDLTDQCNGSYFFNSLRGIRWHDDPDGISHYSCFPPNANPKLGEKAASIDWVICGGESGPHARPMHPDWARGLRDQCAAVGVPFLFKQWGEHVPVTTDSDESGAVCHEYGCGHLPAFDSAAKHTIITAHGQEFWRIGKKHAGRLLDGVEHNGFPEVQP